MGLEIVGLNPKMVDDKFISGFSAHRVLMAEKNLYLEVSMAERTFPLWSSRLPAVLD